MCRIQRIGRQVFIREIKKLIEGTAERQMFKECPEIFGQICPICLCFLFFWVAQQLRQKLKERLLYVLIRIRHFLIEPPEQDPCQRNALVESHAAGFLNRPKIESNENQGLLHGDASLVLRKELGIARDRRPPDQKGKAPPRYHLSAVLQKKIVHTCVGRYTLGYFRSTFVREVPLVRKRQQAFGSVGKEKATNVREEVRYERFRC